MKTNVQPGDRAIVIGGKFPEVIGTIVNVISAPALDSDGHCRCGGLTWDRSIFKSGEVMWVCESLGRPFRIRDLRYGRFLAVTHVGIGSDKNLRRLPDLKEDETVDQDAEVQA